MIFPGFPGVPSFFQVFQVEWEPCSGNHTMARGFNDLIVPGWNPRTIEPQAGVCFNCFDDF